MSIWNLFKTSKPAVMPYSDGVNCMDLVFIVDTTGSMGAFLDAARQHMLQMIRAAMSAAADVRLRLGLVEYRDHSPQDAMLYRIHPLGEVEAMRRVIDGLRADGGGDVPEAVLDGVLAACREVDWAPHARRIGILVGDAPPHGVGFRGDSFYKGCPCGQTVESVTAAAEECRMTLYALGLTGAVAESFGRLARYTGGEYFPSEHGTAAVDRLRQIIAGEFGNIELDRRVVQEWNTAGGDFTIDAAAQKLAVAPGEVSASLVRLGARRLLARPAMATAGG